MMNLPVLRQPSSPAGQYLSFALQGQTYAVDLLGVREIIGYVKPTKVPMMPSSGARCRASTRAPDRSRAPLR